MPKIPTFTTQATITGEVGSVKSNIQMGLNQTIGSALAPITKEIVQHKVKQKDFENKTEALKLENDFIRDMQKVYTEAGNLENEDQAQSIVKNKSNMLMQKYSGLASNKNSQTLFNQYALAEVQKGVFRTSTAVQRNTLISLDTEVSKKKSRLMITALDLTDGFDYEVLQKDLENLYVTNYQGKVPNAILEKMISGIPNEIKFLEADKMISESPREALAMLMDEKDFQGLTYDSRKTLIDKAKITIAPMIEDEYEDHLAKIAVGKETSFDMKTASLVLPTKKVNEMIEQETFAKDRTINNAILLNTPLSLTEEVADGQIKEFYELHGEVKGKANETYVKSIVASKKKALKEDSVGFIKTFDTEVELAYQELEAETDPKLIKDKKTQLIDLLVNKQRDLEVPESSIRLASNAEMQQVIKTLTDPETSAEDKINFMMFTNEMYGNENMGKVLNHLTDLKLPQDYLVALSTNSMELKKDILSASTQDLVKLETLVKGRVGEGEKFNSIKNRVIKNMESFENVLEVQIEGSTDKTELIQSMEDTIYKAALYKVKYKQMGITEAVDTASKEFLRDYKISASETFMIPVDVNGKRTNQILLEQKAEAILLEVESNGTYLDEFHGEDGYMHYAKFAGAENLTEEQVKDRMTANIKNHSKWLMNEDMTGIILYTEYNNTTSPVTNANGDKIEFFFTDTENNKGILSTELKFPVTHKDIELVQESDGLSYLDEVVLDENQNIGAESMTVGSAIDNVGSLFVSKAEASEMPIMTNDKIAKDWSTLYQTSNDPVKEQRAKDILNTDYTVPLEAKNSIAIGAKIFEGDKGLSQTQLIQYGSAIGQIESGYKYKRQGLETVDDGKGVARSYWQIEPKTALDLFRNSSAIFGEKFEKQFAKYNRGSAIGKTSVKYLASLSEEKMSKLLESDSDLAATVALGVIVNRTKSKSKKKEVDSFSKIRTDYMSRVRKDLTKYEGLSFSEASKIAEIVDSYTYGLNAQKKIPYRGDDKNVLMYLPKSKISNR